MSDTIKTINDKLIKKLSPDHTLTNEFSPLAGANKLLRDIFDHGIVDDNFFGLIPFISMNKRTAHRLPGYIIESSSLTVSGDAWPNFPFKFSGTSMVVFRGATSLNRDVLRLIIPKTDRLEIADVTIGKRSRNSFVVKDGITVTICTVENFTGILEEKQDVEDFEIERCTVHSLEGMPSTVKNRFKITGSTIDSLKFMPERVGVFSMKNSTIKAGWLYPYTCTIRASTNVDGYLGEIYDSFTDIYEAAAKLIEDGHEKEAAL